MQWYFRVRAWLYERKRYAGSLMFALGFIWDSLTLTRVDLLYDNIVLSVYLAAAALSIIAFQAHGVGRLPLPVRAANALPLIIQFAFGGLMSGYVIYYSQSGTLVGSWPFLLFLVSMFVGNELFKARYQLLVFQCSVLFIAIFSYTIFSLPVLLRTLGTALFLLSGVVSLLVTALVVYALYCIAPGAVRAVVRPLSLSVATLYLLFHVAYFANVIPPLPLALKDLVIAHRVEWAEDGYRVTYERPPWYRFFEGTSRTYHAEAGESVYAYSAVFAPTALTTTILHRWSYYDEHRDAWVRAGDIRFPILGGRDGGYRGFSEKTVISPGAWRVEVVTEDGRLIGRRTFSIERAQEPLRLTTSVR